MPAHVHHYYGIHTHTKYLNYIHSIVIVTVLYYGHVLYILVNLDQDQ